MKIGLWIHPEELSDNWVRMALDAGLDMLGMHPVGGNEARDSLQRMIDMLQNDRQFNKRIEELESHGIQVEYACHALSWMLPRGYFESHPDWFRLNEDGIRVPDYNCCPSSRQALKVITERAALLAKYLYTDSHRYHFWADDAASGSCFCEECRQFSPSDNLLRITHAILEGIKQVDSLGKLSYLAYHDTINAPKPSSRSRTFSLSMRLWRGNITNRYRTKQAKKTNASTRHCRSCCVVLGNRIRRFWITGWTTPCSPAGRSPRKSSGCMRMCLAKTPGCIRNTGLSI